MTKPLISIIVPCYNVEKYLSKCLNSLLNQTYDNIEIICVEDCSKDSTSSILKDYSKKIKIIQNDKNFGLAFSRNNGVKNAKGEYICFVDSDDYVSKDFVEKLYNSLVKEKADISICDIKCVRNDNEELESCYGDTIVDIINKGYAASACNKLFKKEQIKKYPFEVEKLNEDIAAVIPLLVEAKKIAYAKDTYYYYIQRDSSIQNSRFNNKRFDIFDGVDLALERIEDNKQYKEIKDALVFNQLIATLIYVVPRISNNTERKNVIKEFSKRLNKYDLKNNKYLKQFICSNKLHNKLFYKLFFKYFINNKYSICNFLFNVLNRKLRK